MNMHMLLVSLERSHLSSVSYRQFATRLPLHCLQLVGMLRAAFTEWEAHQTQPGGMPRPTAHPKAKRCSWSGSLSDLRKSAGSVGAGGTLWLADGETTGSPGGFSIGTSAEVLTPTTEFLGRQRSKHEFEQQHPCLSALVSALLAGIAAPSCLAFCRVPVRGFGFVNS